MFKLDFEKTEEPEIKSPTSVVVEKAREFQKNIYFCFIDYTKAFECVNHNKLWKILQEMGIPDHLICLLRNLYAGQELDMKQQTGSKLGKEYVKDVYCHSAYLTSMKNTSCEMPGWRNHKLESRLPREISTTSDMENDTTLMAESEYKLKSLLIRVKEENEKAGLKLSIKKTKIMASIPSIHGK